MELGRLRPERAGPPLADEADLEAGPATVDGVTPPWRPCQTELAATSHGALTTPHARLATRHRVR